jgi:hypothetical protein
MSAFVAFNGFPGQDVQDPIGTLLVPQRQTAVSVPAKPVHVHVLATRRGAPAAATSRHAAARHLRSPRASTRPVTDRGTGQSTTPSQAGQTPSSTQSPTSSSVVPSTPSTPISTTAPSVPDTGVTLPPITVPSLPSPPPPPSGNPQLPVDTSGITGILGNP